MGSKVKSKCDLRKLIDQARKRTGDEDSGFIHALCFHLNILVLSRTEEDLEAREEMCEALLSKLFVDKMNQYPIQPFVCRADENSDWPLQPLPSELFGYEKQSVEDRMKWFYASIKVGDILDCRVTNALKNSYKLKVIHRYGVTRILDDLPITVDFVCFKNEMEVLKSPLLVCELVRVAVTKIEKLDDQVILCVTVVTNNLPFEPIPKLGRYTEQDIPFYVLHPPDLRKFSSYADYLSSKPQFHNPYFYSTLFMKYGLSPTMIYSYFSQFNRKECLESQTVQATLKELRLTDAKKKANCALRALQKKQYIDALKFTEEGMQVCPKQVPLVGKLFEIRSDIYSEQSKPASSLQSCCDLEQALKNSPPEDVKQKCIKKLLIAAQMLYKDRDFKNSAALFEFVLKYDENNECALKCLQRIETKYAANLLDLEATSLGALQEQKRKLLSELKKIKT